MTRVAYLVGHGAHEDSVNELVFLTYDDALDWADTEWARYRERHPAPMMVRQDSCSERWSVVATDKRWLHMSAADFATRAEAEVEMRRLVECGPSFWPEDWPEDTRWWIMDELWIQELPLLPEEDE